MDYSVLSCIMAYYPGEQFESICNVIANQATMLLIVDNSPECSLVTAEIVIPANTIIVSNQNNGAVAGALNIGLELARFKGFAYLQIFDQDTVPDINITERMVKTMSTVSNAGVVSPKFINAETNFPGRVILYHNKWRSKSIWPKDDLGIVEALFTINTASLININLIPKDVYYDERIIIDGVDVDFCLNLRNLGFRIYVNTSEAVRHGIGYRKKGSSRWAATNYSAKRKELSAKNRVFLWRRYFSKYPGYVFNDFVVFLLDSSRTVIFEEGKFSKFFGLLKGIFAGLRVKSVSIRSSVYDEK